MSAAGARSVVVSTRRLALAVGVAWLALDQVTKALALAHLDRRDPLELVWTLQLNLSFNRGASFGIGDGLTGWIIAAGLVLVACLLLTLRTVTGRGSAVALGLVLGGAAGNLADRLFRSHGGAVVDFIDVQWWPVFNVADIGITVGAVLLVLFGFREPDGERAGA